MDESQKTHKLVWQALHVNKTGEDALIFIPAGAPDEPVELQVLEFREGSSFTESLCVFCFVT